MATITRQRRTNTTDVMFDRIYEAARFLQKKLPVLTESEHETLEILLDQKLTRKILRRAAEAEKLYKAGKTLTLEQLKQELGL